MSVFCPKCSALLVPKKEGTKRSMTCSCGYSEMVEESAKITEKVEAGREIEVVEEGSEVLPETEEECPKCKNKKAGYWTVQTRAGDEPETKFLKCTKCKHIWRDYS